MSDPLQDINDASLELHRVHRGKLGVQSKVPLLTKADLSRAYTPGVAAVSRELAARPERARELSLKGNTIAVVSDGSAVLGLGNVGPYAALPVMGGKAVLFKEFAGVDAFPICLDTQDTEEIIKTIKNISPGFGGINLEDIAAPRCFEIERRLQAELTIPVMHDDQHGTAVVVLAALINALTVRKLSLSEARVVVNGSGAAGTAVTDLLLKYGFEHVIVCDSKGALYVNRPDIAELPEKKQLAERTNKTGKEGLLADVIAGAHIFIGVSKGNVLSGPMVASMAERPIIFAMANPVPEIMPDEARAAGAYIVATGRSDFPNQVNNVLAFPGIFRGALDHGVVKITDDMFIQAAKNLAAVVTAPSEENILPDAFDKQAVAAVADAIR